MKCPLCGVEYQDGVTTCSDCGEELVEEPPQANQVNTFSMARLTACCTVLIAIFALPLFLRPSFDEWLTWVTGLVFLTIAIENLYGYFHPDYYKSSTGLPIVYEWRRAFGLGYYFLAKCSLFLLLGSVMLTPPESATGIFPLLIVAFAIHALVSASVYFRLRFGRCSANALHREMIRSYAIDAVLCVFVLLVIVVGMSMLEPMPSDRGHVNFDRPSPTRESMSS